jgi:predicted metal-dependent HD superfamily phosphohydrolase
MSVTLASWENSWRELGRPAADDTLFRRLVACYSETHRRYHTLQHLRECLDGFEQVRSQALHPAEIELGLWFHDAFYDPERDDNEDRSADWARDCLLDAGVDAGAAQRVHELIMATRHDAVPEGQDVQLLVDVDLSILGADSTRFDESNEQIRAEYAHVPDEAYREGRVRILGGFLARPRLYCTDHFHLALEARARDNIRRALARLGA